MKQDYWFGTVDLAHPWIQELMPRLARKFVEDQVVNRALPGGLAKMVYWFSQTPDFLPKNRIVLRPCPCTHTVTAPAGTTRLLAAYIQGRSWPAIIRGSQHHGLLHRPRPWIADRTPPEFLHPKHTPPAGWAEALKSAGQQLEKFTLDLDSEPWDLLVSIYHQTLREAPAVSP